MLDGDKTRKNRGARMMLAFAVTPFKSGRYNTTFAEFISKSFLRSRAKK